jgi:TetR/AcrR family transcriptional repressor of nem operon
MQATVLEFFEANERWLEGVLEEGRREGTLRFAEPAGDAARLIVSALEGAMLVARSYADARRFRTTADALLKSLARAAPAA